MDEFKVSKTFMCDYSHRLHLMNVNHKCRNLHGHTGTIIFTITGALNRLGMVKDFNEFKNIKDWIDEHLDHSVIIGDSDSELLEIVKEHRMKYFMLQYKQSTSEFIALTLVNVFEKMLGNDQELTMLKVDFSETTSSNATVTRTLKKEE